MSYLFTSESVSEGHPDKVADQISDAVLDALLAQDPDSRVACETFVTTGLAVVGGEVTTKAYIDIQSIARSVINRIGYTKAEYMFDGNSCGVLNAIHSQSPDIAMGVDIGGAGDQGMMFGYATNETPEYMPASLVFSHRLVKRLADIRKNEPTLMPYLRPDSKSQVTIEYDGHEVKRVHTVVVSTQHDPDVKQAQIRKDVIQYVINEVIPSNLMDDSIVIHVNPTGNFEIGGPHGDTGLTGRKIIVDTYGGKAPHGGVRQRMQHVTLLRILLPQNLPMNVLCRLPMRSELLNPFQSTSQPMAPGRSPMKTWNRSSKIMSISHRAELSPVST